MLKNKLNIKGFKKPFRRKIHLDNQEWSYDIKDNLLTVVCPKGKNIWKKKIENVLEICEDPYDCRCEYDWDFHRNNFPITPSRVKKFIERTCLKK